MRDILNSYTTSELRQHISKYNKSLGAIRGYSKMKKAELIDLMMKNVDKFKSIKMKPKKETKTTKTATKTTTKTQPKEEPKKETPKQQPKKEEPKKTNFKFNPSKLKIIEKKNILGDKFYKIYYKDNNARIDGFVGPIKPLFFYLDTYEAQAEETQPRAAKGLANFYLCEVLKSLLKDKKLNLTPNSDFKLTAGNISDNHNQSKLNKYYESLGFKKDGKAHASGSQDFKQTISSFLKNCEKFKKTNQS
jgi:hypothetical protein